MFKTLAVGFIMLLTGLALGVKDQVPQCTSEPYGYGIAIIMFLLMAIPSVLSYFAGLEDS